mmetsp:Transcript_102468/g.221175  ORF Transcript_102468/g.221175 Transcript_102468/m.221175 type:complete len:211 (+) Transcript_102468:387-1019(+)
MNDVVGQIMLAARNEDLGSVDLVLTITNRLGLSCHLVQVRSTLGLGQTHCASPLAGHHAVKVFLLEFFRAVHIQSVASTFGEPGVHSPCPVGSGQNIGMKKSHRLGHSLATILLRVAKSLPSTFGVLIIGVLVSGRGNNGMRINILATYSVANFIQRSNHILRKLGGFSHNHIDDIFTTCLGIKPKLSIVFGEFVNILDQEIQIIHRDNI